MIYHHKYRDESSHRDNFSRPVEFSGQLAILRSSPIIVTLAEGTLDGNILDAAKRLTSEKYAWAPPRQEMGRVMLAGMVFDPVIDLSLAKCNYGRVTLVGYSVREGREGCELVRKTAEGAGMSLTLPSPGFINQISGELSFIERRTGGTWPEEALAHALDAPVETVFGFVHYVNMLQMYCGISSRDAKDRASQKFGLSLP